MPSGSSIHISVSPHGSVTGSLMTGTPAAASRACSSRTFLTWIQISTDVLEYHRVPGDLKQSLAEEEHHARMVRRAELPVDSQTQHVAVEAKAAVQVAGAHEDPAAQNVHAI